MQEFDLLIKLAIAEGKITDSKRELLMRSASDMGIDLIEAKKRIDDALKTNKSSNDGYGITDVELVRRTQKWVQLASEDKVLVVVESFPKHESSITKLGKVIQKGQKAIGDIQESRVIDAVANTAKVIPGVGSVGGRIVSGLAKGITNSLGDKKEMKVSNQEIVNMANQYLLIFELRKTNDPWLNEKYQELRNELERRMKVFQEAKKKNKWF
jgi:hypothetical protein